MSQSEPRNPFYVLLMLVSLLFVVTALAVALVPVLEDKAGKRAARRPRPPSARPCVTTAGTGCSTRSPCMVLLGILSMDLDRLRTLQKAALGGHNSTVRKFEPP